MIKMSEYTYNPDKLISEDVKEYLKKNLTKSLLRVLTCGSVDDGKSTLIGRLLYESKVVFEDQLQQLKIDSKKSGTHKDKIDFALLVDGLEAEREQGITIDVAHRYFSSKKRKFIIIDTPGHEQYTRNMVTGASNAEMAIILVDARKGILKQTKRHSFLCQLLGIENFILAVNKIDLVNYDQYVFEKIVNDYKEFTNKIEIKNFVSIPISGLEGDNIVNLSKKTSWYNGPTLFSVLENTKPKKYNLNPNEFCMPVQWVNRPNLDFRGFAGKIISGKVKPKDKVIIMPSGQTSYIDRIVNYDGDLKTASVGQSTTLTIGDDVDCSRGNVITSAKNPLKMSDQFEIVLVSMHEEPILPGRSYSIKIGTQNVSGVVTNIKYKININNMQKIAAKKLEINEIGIANLKLDRLIPFKIYKENSVLGGMIFIDKLSNSTIGCGMINFSLRRAENIKPQTFEIKRDHHANMKNQKPAVLWMTGLSGAGKSTIANELEIKLAEMNRHTFLLDGDNIRNGLNQDLGFTDEDRVENIRRVGEVSKLMADAGLIVIVALISPFRLEREMVRRMINKDEFIEIFIDAPLSVLKKRDTKGLYAKAKAKEIKNFTGIDSAYERPINPEIHINTSKISAMDAAEKILRFLIK